MHDTSRAGRTIVPQVLDRSFRRDDSLKSVTSPAVRLQGQSLSRSPFHTSRPAQRLNKYVTKSSPKCNAKVRTHDAVPAPVNPGFPQPYHAKTCPQAHRYPHNRKLVIIGDGACGKTSLLSVFTLGYFPPYYVPTVFENYITDCRVDGRSVQLALWDTAGQEDYERLRPLAYAKSHVILIGFSVDTPDSFDNVQQKWIDEAHEHCPNVPIILVGLKKDLREDPLAIEEMRGRGWKFTTAKEGEEMARSCGAWKYLECSSLTGEGVDDVFEAATRAALLNVNNGRSGAGCCVIL